MSLHLVVMGASLGSIEALRVLLPALPADFPAAVPSAQVLTLAEIGKLLAKMTY